MTKKPEKPMMLFTSAQEWETWLKKNHRGSNGVRLQISKKGSGIRSVTYAEALDVALCYGWIDGLKQAHDDTFFLQTFTPRRAKSVWSKINTEKATQLIAERKMRPAGLKEIEAAKQDGRWEAAYQSQRNLHVPEDLQAALDRNPKAKAFFATLNSSNRYSFCFRIQTAKKAETRRARIEKFIALLNNRETLHP